MTLFGTLPLGIDVETGLQKEVQVWQINIDGKTETITVVYDIVLLSPVGQPLLILETNSFLRYNRQAVLDAENNVIKEENLRFKMLKESPLGQGILGMITADLLKYPNLEQS